MGQAPCGARKGRDRAPGARRGKCEVMYELFEHTADLGLRVRAARLEDLFAEAAAGMFAAMTGDLESIELRQSVNVELSAEGLDDLLHDWLAELLYAFHSRGVLFRRFEVDLQPHTLRGTAWGEPFDPQRHSIELELKAVTYHGLKVEHRDDGWLAEMVIDV